MPLQDIYLMIGGLLNMEYHLYFSLIHTYVMMLNTECYMDAAKDVSRHRRSSVCLYQSLYTYIYAYICMYRYGYRYAYIWRAIWTRLKSFPATGAHPYLPPSIPVYTCVCVRMYLCMCVCMHALMHVYIGTCTYTYTYVYICMRMYACIHTCTSVHA